MRAKTSWLTAVAVAALAALIGGCGSGGTDEQPVEPVRTSDPMTARDITGTIKARFDGDRELEILLSETPGSVPTLACGNADASTSFRVSEGKHRISVELPERVTPPDWCGIYWLADGDRVDGRFVRFQGPDVTSTESEQTAENPEVRIQLQGDKAVIHLQPGPGDYLRDTWSGRTVQVECGFGEGSGGYGFTRGTVKWGQGKDREQVQLGIDVTGIVTSCVAADDTGDPLARTVVPFQELIIEGA